MYLRIIIIYPVKKKNITILQETQHHLCEKQTEPFERILSTYQVFSGEGLAVPHKPGKRNECYEDKCQTSRPFQVSPQSTPRPWHRRRQRGRFRRHCESKKSWENLVENEEMRPLAVVVWVWSERIGDFINSIVPIAKISFLKIKKNKKKKQKRPGLDLWSWSSKK